ncbi:hypothetical protein L204_100374 [Cryptococcus depauperatus]
MPAYVHSGSLTAPPPLEGIVHVDTANVPRHAPGSRQASGSSGGQSDVANVLKKNQACLQCRRRKLKCDAARPHCSTCIRSYRHVLRTSAKSNPVLCCDYDDSVHLANGSETAEEQARRHDSNAYKERQKKSVSPSAADGNDDDKEARDNIGNGKKKRKAIGEGRRKRKEDDFEKERDRLTKKIEELQIMLATKQVEGVPRSSADKTSAPWTGSSLFSDQSATTPNTLFNLFTTSNHQRPIIDNQVSNSNAMWGNSSAALDTTDLLAQIHSQATHVNHLVNLGVGQDFSSFMGQLPPMPGDLSRRPSQLNDNSPGNMTSGDSSAGPNILSPSELFNFSPADTTNQWSNLPCDQPPDHSLDLMDAKVEPHKQDWRGVEGFETIDVSAFMAQTHSTASHITNICRSGGNVAAAATKSSTEARVPTSDIPIEMETDMDGLQAGLDAVMQQQLLMDIFWPGWPAKLPEPNVVHELIEIFFDLVPNVPRILHRARFLARMTLPPTHSNFPHSSLIHAICAIAATWCDPGIYIKSTRDRQWAKNEESTNIRRDSGSKTTGDFGLRQITFAKEAVRCGLDTGDRLFDVVRAMIILSRVFIDDARMLECWAYIGLVARMILPLGLSVRSAELSLKSIMLPPPIDALEREERRSTVWMAMYHDTIAGAASGWGSSMSLDELTVGLPVSLEDYELETENINPNPQDIESPDLYLKHPVVDSFVMVAKAIILLNRANKFVRRWKNRRLQPNDDLDGLEKPEHKELVNAITCFQMSFPSSLRNVCKLTPRGKLDNDLIAAHLIPHATIICLYEPFADLDDLSDQPTQRLANACQAVVNIVQQLASAVGGDADRLASVMHSSISVCLVTVARTSLLFLRHALNAGNAASAETYRMDCEMIRLTLSHYGMKSKIGQHHAQLLEYFLDRIINPTFEKLKAHYPDHPRPEAPGLIEGSDMGLHAQITLDIKRGFWRTPKPSPSYTKPPVRSSFSTIPVAYSDPSFPCFSKINPYFPQQAPHVQEKSTAGTSSFRSTPDSNGSNQTIEITQGNVSSASGELRDANMESSSGSGTPIKLAELQEQGNTLWHDQFLHSHTENINSSQALTQPSELIRDDQ